MSERFYESPPWRFLLTNLDGVSLVFLDKLCSSREINRTLNAPLRINGTVPSDHPEIFLEAGDGDPYLSEGNRLVYCFRRESDTDPKWVCRAAGTILTVDDVGGEAPMTTWEANDPWQVLYRRPLRNAEGNLPGEAGLVANDNGNDIAFLLISLSDLHDGPTGLDLLTGTIETTDTLEISFQQGMSVGEALDALVETGTMDIVIDPVYDPVTYPGIVGKLNIYQTAGSIRRNAIFAWDKPSRSAVEITRQRDGNLRANKLQYYVGQGGLPVALVTGAASVAKYGRYWEEQFFPGQPKAVVVAGWARKQAKLRADGLVTYTISPAPERSPVPFIDYDIGDKVPIYASSRLREPVADLKRVVSIPLVIGDDQMEAPAQVVLADESVIEEPD
jgi:hypothetical protein